MAALTLAPLFFQAGWLLIATSFGLKVDALGITLGSLFVTGGVIAGHIFIRRRKHALSLLLASVIGVCAGAVLCPDVTSWLAMSLAYLVLASLQSLFVTSLAARVPQDLDGLARNQKVKTGLLVLLSTFSLFQTSRLSTFMGDHTRVECSVMPDLAFFKSHSCLTAYMHAVDLAKAGESNLYDTHLWPDEAQSGPQRDLGPDTTGPYAPFYLDNYMYPPQFLLLPGAIDAVSGDFLVQRAIWFAFCGLMLAMGFWMTARWVGEKGKHHALLLIPLLWSSVIVMITLQVGNVHHVVMVMAVLAMIAFDEKRPVWGGALLAFAMLSKISPGILVVTLLVQRQWRALAWTFAFGILYTLATILFFGFQPVESFLTYQLPMIASGESVKWFSLSDTSTLINSSPFGTPFKLQLLGMKFDDIWGSARIFNSLFTLSIVGIAIWAGLKKKDRTQQLSMWLGLLTLSAMQSPFAPGYVIMPMIWLLTLLAAEVKSTVGLIVFSIVFFLIAFPIPLTGTLGAINSLFQQAVVMGVILFALVRKPGPLSSGE